MFIKQHRIDYSNYFDLEREKHTVEREGQGKEDLRND